MDAEPRGGTPYVRPAYAITELLNEINAAFPGRSKKADGIQGDWAHSQRSSGHNPNGRGVVCALDVTHDATLCSGDVIAETLRANRDPRLLYVIWDRRIFDGLEGDKPWSWHTYTGADPHTGHVHISLRQTSHYYDDRSPWGFGDDVTPEQLKTAIREVLAEELVPVPGEAGQPKGTKRSILTALTQTWGHVLRQEGK